MFKIIIPLNQVSLGKVGPDEKTTNQDTKDFKVSNTYIDTLFIYVLVQKGLYFYYNIKDPDLDPFFLKNS